MCCFKEELRLEILILDLKILNVQGQQRLQLIKPRKVNFVTDELCAIFLLNCFILGSQSSDNYTFIWLILTFNIIQISLFEPCIKPRKLNPNCFKNQFCASSYLIEIPTSVLKSVMSKHCKQYVINTIPSWLQSNKFGKN